MTKKNYKEYIEMDSNYHWLGEIFQFQGEKQKEIFLLLIPSKIIEEFITKALFYFLFLEVIEVMRI